jgi:penicillin-binding protein 1A
MSVRYYLYKTLHVTLLMGLLWLLLAMGVVMAIQWYFIPQLPSIERLKDIRMQVPLQVYTKDGVFIAEYGEQRRIPVAAANVPTLLIKAVLATEDSSFYVHSGVDIKGLFRATFSLLKTGKKQQGGSTITMQVARNFFLSRKRTFARKFNEILLAFRIDEALSKDEILELYLNKIYFGHRAYGVGAAAQVYYGKSIFDLTLPQWAMLAGLPKAPSTNNPLTNPARALERRNYVLKRMLTLKYISQEDYETAINTPLTAKRYKRSGEVEALYVAEMVRSFLLDKFGEEITYTHGYRVFTTIDSHLQETANLALRNALFTYDQRHGFKGALAHVSIPKEVSEVDKWAHEILQNYPTPGNLVPSLVLNVKSKSVTAYNQKAGQFQIAWPEISWARRYITDKRRGRSPKSAKRVVKRGDIIMARLIKREEKEHWALSQVPEVEGALAALNTNDGAIIALVGGFDFYHSKFNRATQALRQPGSSFKPFIYSAALAKGRSPSSRVLDRPISFRVGRKRWSPHNSTHKYYGWTTLRKALTYSFNVSAVRLLTQIKVKYTIDHISKFGFDRARIPKNLTMTLGTGELTPLELASGYAAFANGGFRVKPYFIERIEDINGKVIFSANPLTICRECPPEIFALSENEVLSDILAPSAICTQTPRYAPRIISTRNAYMMSSMLKDVIRVGTGRRSKLQREDIAGKTGTTNELRDAWFAGYSPDIVTTAWVGFDKPRSLGRKEYGGKVALPMWADFMSVALEGQPVKSFQKPRDYKESPSPSSKRAKKPKKRSSPRRSSKPKPSTSPVIQEQLF